MSLNDVDYDSVVSVAEKLNLTIPDENDPSLDPLIGAMIGTSKLNCVINTLIDTPDNITTANPIAAAVINASNVLGRTYTSSTNPYDNAARLLCQYNQGLIDKGWYRSYASGDNLDVLDISEVSDRIRDREKYVELSGAIADYLANNFYAVIPCYERGKVICSDYLHFLYDIVALDLDALSMTVRITGYRPKGCCCGIDADIIIASMLIEYRNGIDETGQQIIDIVQKCDIKPSVMYQTLNLKAMRWSKDDRIAFKKIFGTFIEKQSELVRENYGGAIHATYDDIVMQELSSNFNFAILISNYTLHKNRAKIHRQVKKNPLEETVSVEAFDPKRQMERKFRSAGLVKFYSRSCPREANQDIVRHYQVATWKVRGHTRTCPSGKVIYIKETTAHRKCLYDKGRTYDPAANTININKGKEHGQKG